jgi:hypothetical protein
MLNHGLIHVTGPATFLGSKVWPACKHLCVKWRFSCLDFCDLVWTNRCIHKLFNLRFQMTGPIHDYKKYPRSSNLVLSGVFSGKRPMAHLRSYLNWRDSTSAPFVHRHLKDDALGPGDDRGKHDDRSVANMRTWKTWLEVNADNPNQNQDINCVGSRVTSMKCDFAFLPLTNQWTFKTLEFSSDFQICELIFLRGGITSMYSTFPVT